MKKSNNLPLLLSLAGVIIIAAFGAFFWLKNQDPTKNYSPKYTVSEKGPSAQDKNTAEASKTTAHSSLPQTSDQVPSSAAGDISIDDLEQKNGFVNAKASTINFSVATCVYEFTSDGARPITRETSGSCSGISIPQAEFEKIGIYTLKVTAYSTDQKLSSTKTIDIK